MTDPKPKLVAVGSPHDTSDSERAPQQRRRWTDLGVGFWLLPICAQPFAAATSLISTAPTSGFASSAIRDQWRIGGITHAVFEKTSLTQNITIGIATVCVGGRIGGRP